MFKTMLLIREFEQVAHRMLMEGLVHASVHQSIGRGGNLCRDLRQSAAT
jgi:TPP-dependent pyruvate/acetoin dehydrogenase alpha subunit